MAHQEFRSLSLFATLLLWLRFTLGFLLIAVTAMPWMAAALLLLPWRPLRIKLVNYYGKLIGYSIVRLLGIKPVVRHPGRLKGSFPAIYIANHASALDAFVSIWLCPVGGCGVVKKQLARIPFFGQLYQLSGHLMIDRQKSSRAIAALNDTAALVKRYRLGIWIMPEGTRSSDGRLLPLKTGFVHLAIATSLPVVPVLLHGAHRIWPNRSLRIFGRPLHIEVLPAIDTSGWRVETAREHAEAVHAIMAAGLDETQRPLAAPSSERELCSATSA